MRHTFETITPDQWLNILNEESSPERSAYTLQYLKCGEQVFVRLKTGIGNFSSPPISLPDYDEDKVDEMLDEQTKVLENQFEEAKGKFNESGEKAFMKIGL